MLHFAIAVVIVPMALYSVYRAIANRNRAFLLATTPVVEVAKLVPGMAQVQGRAVALSTPLTAPFSGKSCVYYRFQVEEKRTVRRGPFGSSHYWKTVVDDVQNTACGIDDGTGVAPLDLCTAEFVLAPGTQLRTGFWSDTLPELERVLQERYGRSSRGLFLSKAMRYSETCIEVGSGLAVLGSWRVTPSGPWQLGKGDDHCIVSDRSCRALASSYRRGTLSWFALAVLLLVAARFALGPWFAGGHQPH